MDIGTPERYLQGTFDILEGNVRTGVAERLGDGFLAVDGDVRAEGRIVPPAVVGAGARSEPARTSAASSCSGPA